MDLVKDNLIPVLCFVIVVAVGAAFLLLRARQQSRIRRRLEDTTTEHEAESGVSQLLARFGQRVASKSPSKSLQAQLARAGYHKDSAASIYLGSKVVLLFLGLLMGGLVTMVVDFPLAAEVLFGLGSSAAFFFFPNIVVSVNRKTRERAVRNHLPDAVDLLEICVTSGMGLDMAWNAVSDEIRRVSDTLADEMTLTNLEMHLGATRVVAMRNMVERTGAEELGSLVAVLLQSERFGTSIGDALRAFATTAREVRSQRAEENAERTAVKLLFPMVFFIFPAVLVVVGGPAGLRLSEIMGG